MDADDPWEEVDYTEDQDDADASSVPDSPANEESDEDEDEDTLLAELAKIKRERAEESARVAAEKKAADETIRMENILRGNPLLNNAKDALGTFITSMLSFIASSKASVDIFKTANLPLILFIGSPNPKSFVVVLFSIISQRYSALFEVGNSLIPEYIPQSTYP